MNLKWLINPISLALLIAISFLGLAAQDSIVNAQVEDGKIEPLLLDRFTTDGSADFIVRFDAQADLSAAYGMDWNTRGEFVYTTLRETADKSQVNAKAILDKAGLKYQTMIGGNDLYVWSGTPIVADEMSALSEVYFIRATRTYTVDPIKISDPIQNISWAGDYLVNHWLTSVGAEPEATTDWGITDTKANQAWALGARGAGIKVANIDTGVQWNHPALVGQFACASGSDPACWADPSNICGGTACDNSGHGTHTMGTMVAKDNPALPYIAGMAPDATWIACKGCESNSCSSYALTTCADWILAPGGNPANRPNVVNNSWGSTSDGNSWYLSYVNAWRAAGVFPAFAAGNNGPTCDSMGDPGSYQASFASAAHDSNRAIASFSSRGASFFGHDPYTKPNISAPGVGICSTVPTNGWACGYSGTSMASPHTAGAVAQLWSCAPGLVGQIDATFQALQNSADTPPAGSCGAPPDGQGNYTFGYGYLDVLSLVTENCGSPEPDINVIPTSMHPVLLPDTTFEVALTIENLGTAALDWNLSDDAAWLSEDTASGVVQAGGSVQIMVTFDTTGLTPGVYPASLTVNSNDPDEPTVTVPVTLEVIPAEPDISLVYLPLDMTLLPSETGTMFVHIENLGNADLVWSLTDDAGWLSELPTGGTIVAGDTKEVVITFNSTGLAAGFYQANIVISSNDPDQPDLTLPATLTVIEPDILITSPPLDMSLFPNETGTINFTIENIGTADLEWSATDDAAWLSEQPASGRLVPGGSTEVIVTFDAGNLSPGEYSGQITIASNDPDEPVITLDAILTINTPESDLAVIKTADPSADVGNPILYTLNVINNGPQATTGVLVVDTLPDLVMFVSASPQCAEAMGMVTCDIGDLSSGGTADLTITVTAADGGIASNTAVVSADNIDPNPNNNMDTADTTISEADILVTAPVLDIALSPDETGIMSFTIENIGQADLLWNLDETTPVSWLSEQPDYGTLGPGDIIEVEVAFEPSGLTPGLYQTDIDISSNDPDEPSIVLPVNLTVLGPDISITAPALEATLFPDETSNLTMTISNNGAANLYWSMSDGAPWLSEVPDAGIIPSGGSTEVLITFDSTGLTPGSFDTDLVITSNDPDEPEIILSANLTVIQREVDLVVRKTASANTVNIGDTITYTLVITNNGPQDAAGVILTDTLPALVSLLHAPPGCTESSQVISCEIGDLGVDNSVTLTIVVTATGVGDAINNAEVSSDLNDPDMTNNTDSVSIRIDRMMIKLFIPMLQRH